MTATTQQMNVLITGASRGIGRALVAEYAGRGARVLAVARTPANLIGEPRTNVGWIAADLARPAGWDHVIRAVRESGMTLDLLVNNAGIQMALDLRSAPDDAIRASIETELALNLAAPIALCHGLMPYLRRPGGTIVNVTSLVSRQPKPSAPVYSASKAGLASFTRSLRRQLAADGVRVVEAVPPLVATDMTDGRGSNKLTPEAMADAIVAGVARGKTTIAPGLSSKVLVLNRLLPGFTADLLARA
ncbi:MAG: SDR family NAD(P)-dependent oxidoreductase [Bauldia sp.]|nr:SDR family NAD(P)-dependent oxidoreductase [Bauldia sp.]